MANHRDKNPFDEEEDVNPFSNPSHYSHSTLSVLPPEPASYNYDRKPVIDINKLDKATSLKRKERELQAKEAELKRREEEVRKKEEALARAGVFLDVRNWPPFFPIIHNDIANEIPTCLHRMLYVAFATYLGIVLCLFWCIIAATAATFKGEDAKILLLAAIYFIIGTPAAYIFWYRPLYRACRKDSAFNFGWFFMFYMVHISYCIYAVVSPPFLSVGLSYTGVLSSIYVLNKRGFVVGIFYLIGCAFLCVEIALSIWVIQRVYRFFRGNGQAAEGRRNCTRGTPMAPGI